MFGLRKNSLCLFVILTFGLILMTHLFSASEKLGKSSSHSDCSVGLHSVGHHHDLIGRKPIKKNDSDSGRGESESETHSRNHHKVIE